MVQTRRRLHHKPKSKRNVKKLAIVLLVVLVFGYFFLLRPVLQVKAKASAIQAHVPLIKEAFKNNDLEAVDKELKEVQVEYASLQRSASRLYWARFVPIVGWYVGDMKNAIEAGDSLIQAGLISLDAITPYADLLGFKKGEGSSFANKSADERIQTAVLTLDKVLVKVDAISVHVDDARKKLDAIDVNHYPKKIGNRPVGEKLTQVVEQFDSVAALFVDAKPLLKELPSLMGSDKQKTYVILFQNDKELRPTGGFLTAYAIFYINQGKLKVERSQDIYSLDDAIAVHPTAPDKILAYHKGVSKFYIRDSNLSPDFPSSVKLFDSLYSTSRKAIPYDGVIAMDTTVLVDTLRVLGDTEVRGTVFSANNDPRCNCPQVIYKLLDEIDRPVGYFREDRKGILGDLLFALMQKALGSSPSQYWGNLSQDMLKNFREKHILAYLKDPAEQAAIETINFGGTIKAYEGDYLHINDTNFAGAKSNLYVKHKVVTKTKIQSDGTVERELVIEYTNPKPHSNCNLEAGQLCVNAVLRNWMRIYVPKGSTLQSLSGSQKKVLTYDELDKTVFEGFFGVAPLGKSTITVKYTLPMKVQNQKDYSLLIQKQPGTLGHDYTVSVNSKIVRQLPLIEDLEYKSK